MSEPRRWSTTDEISPELRELLRSATPPSALPSPVRRRVLTRLSTLAPLVTVFGMSLKAAATTFVASAVVSSAAIVGVHEWQTAQSENRTKTQEPTSAPARGRARAAAARPPPPPANTLDQPLEEESETLPNHQDATLPSTQAAMPLEPRASARPEAVEPTRDRLEREAALLERARAALQSAPLAALAAAQQHAKSFPQGQLEAERMLIQADALRRLGRIREARREAEQALEQYPGGLYAERVRQFLDELAE